MPPSNTTNPKPTATSAMPSIPRIAIGEPPVSVNEQLDALRQVQTQAEERVQLGMQLFKAAENRLSTQKQVLDKFKQDNDAMREEVREDVARSLQQYDQWLGQMDDRLTQSMQDLESRLDTIQTEWAETKNTIQKMVSRVESLVDDQRYRASRQGHQRKITDLVSAVNRKSEEATPTVTDAPGEQVADPRDATAAEMIDAVQRTRELTQAKLASIKPTLSFKTEEATHLSEANESNLVYSKIISQLRDRTRPLTKNTQNQDPEAA